MAWSEAATCRASAWRSIVGSQGRLRPEPPLAENPGIKCVFGREFRVSKPYLYGGLTGSRIWAFWRDFERVG
jgi:hypothetical protein